MIDTIVDAGTHEKLAKELFNMVWELIDKPNRTEEEDNRMIHAAHASCYHWEVVGTPLNQVRGEWQISRVYSLLKRSDAALFHAQRSLDLCRRHGYGDFDLAFAYEALARAYATAGDTLELDAMIKLAESAGVGIKKKADREYFTTELDSIP